MENKLHTRGLFSFQMINFKVVGMCIMLNKGSIWIAKPFKNGFRTVMRMSALSCDVSEISGFLGGTSCLAAGTSELAGIPWVPGIPFIRLQKHRDLQN